jgi:glutathione synthase
MKLGNTSMKNIAIQMDYPHQLKPAGDSTICLIEAAQKRGINCFFYHYTDLSWRSGELFTNLHPFKITDLKATNWYELGEAKTQSLHEVDLILMRQDPPFDMNYIASTYLLEQISGDTLVVNDPASVRAYPEKLLPLMFENALPDSLITSNRTQILAFLQEHKDIILKPLFGFAGHSVLRLRHGGDNVEALLEMVLAPNGGRPALPIIAQKFLSQVVSQDIRTVIINGMVVGSFARTPAEGEVRANMRVGGTPVKVKLNAHQMRLAENIADTLYDLGIYIAGLDFIGDYVTEVNVTSPTGLRTIINLYGDINPAEDFWDGVEDLLHN